MISSTSGYGDVLVMRHWPQAHRWYTTSPSLTWWAETAVQR